MAVGPLGARVGRLKADAVVPVDSLHVGIAKKLSWRVRSESTKNGRSLYFSLYYVENSSGEYMPSAHLCQDGFELNRPKYYVQEDFTKSPWQLC